MSSRTSKIINAISSSANFEDKDWKKKLDEKYKETEVLTEKLQNYFSDFLGKEYDDISFKQVVSEIDIRQLVDKQLSVLSGGEIQRVLLARSLLNNPDLLVLDEPAQNLDISGQLSFYKLIQEIYSKRDISILMVSHDLHLVMVSTKKVLCLSNHICCSGKPQQVAQDPEFISMFGKDMANMMAVYQHTNHTSQIDNHLIDGEVK